MKISVAKMASAAVIAAIYAVLTLILAPISYGPIQFRISEVLCILPFFLPFSTWGLFVGCILANLLSAYGSVDVVLGSAATLLAALTTMYIGERSRSVFATALACLPPVVFNGVLVGAAIAFAETSESGFMAAFAINGIQVAVSEAVVMYIITLPLAIWLGKAKFFQKLTAKYSEL